MGVPEIYIKLAVGYARDPKVRALVARHGEEGILARDLFVQMICYCRELLSDGQVPADELPVLMYPLGPERVDRLVKLLLDAGLITCQDPALAGASHLLKQGSGCAVYVIPAYVKRNGTRAAVEAAHDARVTAGQQGGTAKARGRKRAGHGAALANARGGGLAPASDLLKQTPPVTPPRESETESESDTGGTGSQPRTGEQRAHVPNDGQTERVSGPEDDELLHTIADAVEVSGGGVITPDQARQVRDRLVRGRNIPDPGRQLVNLITTMTEAELRHLVPGTGTVREPASTPRRDSLGDVPRPSPADRSPASRTVAEVMSAGRTGPPAADPTARAAAARAMLANRTKPEEPEPPTADDAEPEPEY